MLNPNFTYCLPLTTNPHTQTPSPMQTFKKNKLKKNCTKKGKEEQKAN
jgi:hypothetical protein